MDEPSEHTDVLYRHPQSLLPIVALNWCFSSRCASPRVVLPLWSLASVLMVTVLY